MDKILISGGAGFAGSSLALLFKSKFPKSRLLCFDNLRRRGSELALTRLKEHGIEFAHGDVRVKEDLLDLGDFDLIIDCSAEPSVMAGVNEAPNYVIQTNLNGTLNCLELARRARSTVVFLSTSRVYPIHSINALEYREEETRFSLAPNQTVRGVSERGLSEEFSLQGARSIYGASKLCSELMLQEYIESYGIKAVINRCGVLTGPWQMGKVDQGVIVLWIAKHIYNKELAYFGYGGSGKQVRDILHIADLFTLLIKQLDALNSTSGKIFNVGGGLELSLSLRELSALCQKHCATQIPIKQFTENRPNDLIWYVSDSSLAQKTFSWRANYTLDQIISEIAQWIGEHKLALAPILS